MVSWFVGTPSNIGIAVIKSTWADAVIVSPSASTLVASYWSRTVSPLPPPSPPSRNRCSVESNALPS